MFHLESEDMESPELLAEQTEAEVKEVSVEELLISCVQARHPIWDSRLPLKDRAKNIRDSMWIEIYEEFGSNPDFSVEYLMKKWRNLRDTYVRIKGEYVPSGSSAKKKKKWEYLDSMKFLDDTLDYRPTVTNLSVGPQEGPSTSRSPMVSPTLSNDVQTKSSQKADKIEGAILTALNKINVPTTPPPPIQIEEAPINPICKRISEILMQMPQKPRTSLEIKLLQMAFDTAKDYLD